MAALNWDIAIAVAFIVGVLLFGISTSMLRSSRDESAPVIATAPAWPQLVDDSLTGAGRQLRLDMVERLSIIGEPWCVDVLRAAMAQERDATVRSAITDALGARNIPPHRAAPSRADSGSY